MTTEAEHSEIIEKQGKAFDELKTAFESTAADTAEGKEKILAINKTLDDLGEQHQKALNERQSEQEAKEALEERVKELETTLSRPGSSADDEKKEAKEHMAALNLYARKGHEIMMGENPEEFKRLRTDSNVDGGYLVEPEFVREILKDITEISNIRSIARVRSTNRKTVMVPTRISRTSSAWNGEGTAAIDSNSTYGLEEMSMGKLSVATIITNEELSDASFNMETEIREDVSEEFARAEGAAFVSGDSVNMPQGFLVNPDIETFTSNKVGIIDWDDLINITGELKTGYNPSYLANRRTIAGLRALKDGQGQYLWNPAAQAANPNTINGDPLVSIIDMPDVATGQQAIAYGDFRRGYWIVDRSTMTMIRDPFTRANTDEVVLTFHRRLTGQVVKAEAIKTITVQ